MRLHRGVLRGRVPALRLVPAYRHARPDPGEGCMRARAHARTRSTPTLPGWAHAAPMQCRGRCSPPDALDAQRVVLRHAPAQWPPLDACARRWQRCRAPRRCPLHALALSPRTQPSGESFCTGLCSLDGRHCGTWWHVGDCGRWGVAAGAGPTAVRGGVAALINCSKFYTTFFNHTHPPNRGGQAPS